MRKMFVLMNHQLTEDQKVDASKNWSVTEFIYPPENLQKQWGNIDPESKVNVQPFLNWMTAPPMETDNLLLIGGEAGHTFKIVSILLGMDCCFMPVYATTMRESKETMQKDGSVKKISVFKHVRFRAFEQY